MKEKERVPVWCHSMAKNNRFKAMTFKLKQGLVQSRRCDLIACMRQKVGAKLKENRNRSRQVGPCASAPCCVPFSKKLHEVKRINLEQKLLP